MSPQQHYSSSDNDQLIVNNFSEEELSEIMLSLVANNNHDNSLATNYPNYHHAANYYYHYGYNNDTDTISGGIGISSSILIDNILNTTTSSSESDLGLSPPMAAAAAAHCPINHQGILLNNLASGIVNNREQGSTTSFEVANCYQPTANNYTRTSTPSSAPVAVGDNYHGTTANSNDVKVGQYTAEERKDRILRYLKKRNQRNFNKTIKYACRKTLADRRVRVRGRFARNSSELCEEDITPQRRQSEDDDGHHHRYDLHQSYTTDNDVVTTHLQEEEEEEEDQWLQEAMASLLYAPYINAAG